MLPMFVDSNEPWWSITGDARGVGQEDIATPECFAV